MIEQDPSTYSSDSQSRFVEDWEANIEKIERNRKIMREGREAAEIYKPIATTIHLTSPLIRERAFLWEKECHQKRGTTKSYMIKTMTI